jgi:hypothetical protein
MSRKKLGFHIIEVQIIVNFLLHLTKKNVLCILYSVYASMLAYSHNTPK